LVAGKLIVAGCGVVAVLIGLVIAFYSERVLSLYYVVTSIIAGGLAGLFLLAFLSPRANTQGAYAGIAACLLFSTWATLTSGQTPVWDLGAGNFKLHPVMIGVLGHLVLLSVGLAASFCFPQPEPGSRDLTLWGWIEKKRATRPNESSALGAGLIQETQLAESGKLRGGAG
jgi:SSS family solute:Na+ symporter